MKIVVPASVLACVALVLIPALPAAAVVDTQSWTSSNNQWWTTPGAWSSGEAPEAGDTLVFGASGSALSTKNASIALTGIQFTASHEVANGGGVLGLGAGGLTTAPGTVVSVNSDISTTGAQTWSIGAGSTATFPGVILTDGTALTLDVEGTMNIAGNVDALGTGSVVKTGAGTIVRSGGAGGGIGNGGLSVQEGTFFLNAASIDGTAFAVAGGALTGVGTANSINLASGMIRPGAVDGTGVGHLTATGASTWSGGTYSATLNGSASDLFEVYAQPLSVSGTALDLVVETVPAVGTDFVIVDADAGITGQFTSEGAALADGVEFASNGYRYRISYPEAEAVVVTYLGPVPVPVIPPAPVPTPQLAATGAVVDGMLGASAAMLLLTGAVLLIGRRRRTA